MATSRSRRILYRHCGLYFGEAFRTRPTKPCIFLERQHVSAILARLVTDDPLVPGFEILERIGEGGMGTVYRARQLSLDRLVAIKVLHPQPAGSLAALRREPRFMAASAHPNVVSIHDCGQVGAQVYLVMEHVDGNSLRDRMTGQPWPLDVALSVANQIAAAVEHIHGCGLLHLDLKPENVLFDAGGTVKVTDFGLARSTREGRRPPPCPWGSAEYCPPEQRHGLGVDERTDLFALASISYELLTGRLPGRIVLPVQRWNPKVPAAVEGVLLRGLRRDPDERYATVAEFRAALGNAADGLRRHPVWGSLAAISTGLLLAVPLLFHAFQRSAEKHAESGPPTSAPAVAGPANPAE
jgi:serine/threonine protein kinase